MAIYGEGWTGKRYFWYFWKFKLQVTYWMYERTPKVFGKGWETTKYDMLYFWQFGMIKLRVNRWLYDRTPQRFLKGTRERLIDQHKA
jgi:hypothetical protein